MKRALVCGAGGFIGSHLVRRLKKEGYFVRGVDLKYPEFSKTEADEFIKGDLRNLSIVDVCIDGVDEVYQLAADMGGADFIFTGENDSDIICKDRKVLCEYILKELEVYKEYGYEIVVKEKGVRHHIDLIPPGFVDMNYRIDLLDEFPYLQQFHHHTNKIEVKDEFYDFLLERKIKKEFEYLIMFGQDGTFEVNFPNPVDDLVVRFMEWVWQPHKSRHINYVINNIQDTSEFIDIVTSYTNIEIDDDYMKELLK